MRATLQAKSLLYPLSFSAELKAQTVLSISFLFHVICVAFVNFVIRNTETSQIRDFLKSLLTTEVPYRPEYLKPICDELTQTAIGK